MGPAAADAGDTGHGSAGTPRLGAGLMAGVGRHGVRLAVVLPHVRVHKLDHVRADGDLEDSWKSDALSTLLALVSVDRH